MIEALAVAHGMAEERYREAESKIASVKTLKAASKEQCERSMYEVVEMRQLQCVVSSQRLPKARLPLQHHELTARTLQLRLFECADARIEGQVKKLDDIEAAMDAIEASVKHMDDVTKDLGKCSSLFDLPVACHS